MRDEGAEREVWTIMNDIRTEVRKAGEAVSLKIDQIVAIHKPVFKRGVEQGGMHNVEGGRPIRDQEVKARKALNFLRVAWRCMEKARAALADEVKR